MEEVKRALTVFENHSILQRIEGKFNQADCRFAILPDHSDCCFERTIE